MNSSESELLARVKQADDEAFRVLFEKYHAMLFRNVFYKLRDERLAQDIAQEAFLKFWVYRDRIKPHLPFFPYVEKMARNLILDHYKRENVRAKHRDHVQRLVDIPPEQPDEEVRLLQLEEKIRHVVVKYLPEKCRAIFLLSRVEGLSNPQIAEMLGISRKTVENQLYNALKVLRKKCSEHLG
ncbi:RNA polymerase sigma factor [Sulfidibacter corallicola]|uniref:RNA polymerase sigma factor n=1 Tax=Sulfidibacter corallicola TaxID=2818388 RepID=UPI001F013CE3|nr:RNA polymerase sigma-70 factor [Sulfidibacter corallicola]